MIVDAGIKDHPDSERRCEAADYAIIYNTLHKDTCNSEKEAVQHIYRQLRDAEPRMMKPPVVSSINYSSVISVMTWVKLAVTRSTAN